MKQKEKETSGVDRIKWKETITMNLTHQRRQEVKGMNGLRV